jgi:hypothetical protein
VIAVEVTYDRDPAGHRSVYERFEEPEIAAQFFESEAGTPPSDRALLVEELSLGKKLEEYDEETGKRVVAYELVGAVV